jgi:hypothetical protein
LPPSAERKQHGRISIKSASPDVNPGGPVKLARENLQQVDKVNAQPNPKAKMKRKGAIEQKPKIQE